MIDGEGTVALTIWKANFLPFISVTNTDYRVIDWLRTRFGGQILRHDRGDPRHKPRYNWRLSGKRATTVLALVRPYLVLKAEQADLAISYYAGQGSFHWGNRKLPEAEFERRRGLHAQLKALNGRGPNLAN